MVPKHLMAKIIVKGLRPHGKHSFLAELPPKSKILDVGCGNNSPFIVKQMVPGCDYTGIDVGDYNQTQPNLADHYIIAKPEEFGQEISKLFGFDAVLSAHNLEHCDDRDETFRAMLASLKVGGRIYLSFPCEESVKFPNRRGALNYFDDDTHKLTPPDFGRLIASLKNNNFEIIFSAKRYRPVLLWLIGLALEPLSAVQKKKLPGTWEFYGFESIIWAKKL